MNDQHTFAIMLRSMRDHGTDKRRASISLEVDAAAQFLLRRAHPHKKFATRLAQRAPQRLQLMSPRAQALESAK